MQAISEHSESSENTPNERKSFLNSPVRFVMMMLGYGFFAAMSWFPIFPPEANWKIGGALFCISLLCLAVGDGSLGGGRGKKPKCSYFGAKEGQPHVIKFFSKWIDWRFFLWIIGGSLALGICGQLFLSPEWRFLNPRTPVFIFLAAWFAWHSVKQLFVAQQNKSRLAN